MTERRRDGQNKGTWSEWIREHPELDSNVAKLSVQDNDYWVHCFSERNEKHRSTLKARVDHVMLLEVKAFGADQPFAQQDTLDVINQILRLSTVKNDRRRVLRIRDNRRGRVGVIRLERWFGYHILRMSGATPDRSQKLLWDEVPICEPYLVELLRFERDPDHPTKPLETRRHHPPPDREVRLDLFDPPP
jgi:hypothetical protein